MKKIAHILSFYYRKYFAKRTMPSYEEKREIINRFANEYSLDVFVETGTFMGDTIEFFKGKFKRLYSIELSEALATKASDRFHTSNHVTIVQGDSGEKLKMIVEEISGSALYWLDGHYSSEFFLNDEYVITAKGEKETPVLLELQILLNDKFQHVILVDDARLFNGKNDYPTLRDIKQLVSNSRHQYTFQVAKDIIQLIPKK